MMKLLGISAAAITAGLAGVALLGYSPLSCACLSPKQHLALVAGLNYSDANVLNGYDAEEFEAGLNRELLGKPVTPGQPHQYFLECTPQTSTRFTCLEITDESFLLKRGYFVTVDTDGNGNFRAAKVIRTWAWL